MDEISIRQSDTVKIDGNTLDNQIGVVGKRLSSRAYLSYEQGLGDTAMSVTKLTYNLTPKIKIVSQAGTDSALDVFILSSLIESKTTVVRYNHNNQAKFNKSMNKKTQQILIATGFSGAGISSALKNLEDLGYEVFDNFPLTMIDPLLQDTCKTDCPIAIGIDTRTRGFDPKAVLASARQLGASLLFLTADEGVLQKRYTATRRRHPLAKDRPVNDGIRKELTFCIVLRQEPILLSTHPVCRFMICDEHWKVILGWKIRES